MKKRKCGCDDPEWFEFHLHLKYNGWKELIGYHWIEMLGWFLFGFVVVWIISQWS